MTQRSDHDDPALAAELHAAVARVVDFANYHATRRVFYELYRRLAVAGVVVATGVGVYAYEVSRPSSDPLFITTPTPVIVTLPQDEEWRDLLGPACDLTRVAAVAVEGELARPTVVTVTTANCRSQRFRIPSQGVAVPARQLPAGL